MTWPAVPAPMDEIRFIGVVDCEATSTDPTSAELIDLAVCVLEVNADGEVIGIAELKQALRDRGIAIPPEVVRLTGICDADVAGVMFDAESWTDMLGRCDMLVAHNAADDAVVLERLLPGIREQNWACSLRETDWPGLDFDGRPLGYVILRDEAGVPLTLSSDVRAANLITADMRDGSTLLRNEPANPFKEG